MAIKSIQAIISGKVHGVGYRYFAVHVAQQLGIEGTVRNNSAGDVEVNAYGEELKLVDFIAALHEGPNAAEVSDVRVAWSGPPSKDPGDGHGFHAVP